MEAEFLGISFDIIKRGGEWKVHLGCLETHYLGKLPSDFARVMAGFWQKQFFLERNQTIYGESNEEWLETCADENDDQDDDVQSSFPKTNPRAVILQDAVILIAAGRCAPFNHFPVFSGPVFSQYKSVVLAATDAPQYTVLQDYESLLAPVFVGAHNEIPSRTTKINAAFNSFDSAIPFKLHQLSSQQEALVAQQQILLGSVLVPSAPSRQRPVPLQPAPSLTTSTPTTSCRGKIFIHHENYKTCVQLFKLGIQFFYEDGRVHVVDEHGAGPMGLVVDEELFAIEAISFCTQFIKNKYPERPNLAVHPIANEMSHEEVDFFIYSYCDNS
ncbi:hypothetical protein [Parasitella parasitica]|uniref:Uncharacterized protein n=1 Tax=Parasitella parasitica TaxID=35722 RepID=A0A0B7NQA2_9FUNG|nr:hypothetical protein [Parasitella parasitica]